MLVHESSVIIFRGPILIGFWSFIKLLFKYLHALKDGNDAYKFLKLTHIS